MNKVVPMQGRFTKPLEHVQAGAEYDNLLKDLAIMQNSIALSGCQTEMMQYFIDRATKRHKGKIFKYNQLERILKKLCYLHLYLCLEFAI